jgi:hypothetical protein
MQELSAPNIKEEIQKRLVVVARLLPVLLFEVFVNGWSLGL